MEAEGKMRREAATGSLCLGVRQSWPGVPVKVETKQNNCLFFLECAAG